MDVSSVLKRNVKQARAAGKLNDGFSPLPIMLLNTSCFSITAVEVGVVVIMIS